MVTPTAPPSGLLSLNESGCGVEVGVSSPRRGTSRFSISALPSTDVSLGSAALIWPNSRPRRPNESSIWLDFFYFERETEWQKTMVPFGSRRISGNRTVTTIKSLTATYRQNVECVFTTDRFEERTREKRENPTETAMAFQSDVDVGYFLGVRKMEFSFILLSGQVMTGRWETSL